MCHFINHISCAFNWLPKEQLLIKYITELKRLLDSSESRIFLTKWESAALVALRVGNPNQLLQDVRESGELPGN
jgi:hypothetical protein